MRSIRGISTALAVAVIVSVFPAVDAVMAEGGHDHEKSENIVLVGEVLDLYCYMQHPEDGQGMDHVKCAKTCINKGLPIGFLSDGVVYLLLGKEHNSAADLVVDFAGIQSRLTGKLIEHDGVKSIEVVSIEPVKSKKG